MADLDRRTLLRAGALWAASLGCAVTRPGRARSHRIVVVGAGLAGLVVAHELMKRGRDVLVLEALPQVGGRIRTVRDFRAGLYAEAGATHVIGDEVHALVAELGVELTAAARLPGARVWYGGGVRRVVAPGASMPARPGYHEDERALDDDGLRRRYLSVLDRIDPDAMQWSAELAAIDRVSMADWLQAQGASSAYLEDINDTFPLGLGLDTVSALAVLRELAGVQREIASAQRTPRVRRGNRIAGGADHLPRALAARLGARVVVSAEVKRIEHDPGGATVIATRHGSTVRFDAAAVVLTMPFPVLRAVEVSPRWSPDKARAIAALDMSPVTRVWLECDAPFWAAGGLSGRAETDLRSGMIRPETETPTQAAGALLGVYATQQRARALATLAPADRIAAVRDDCERAFPGALQHAVGGASVAWDREPFARGGYAWFKPGQLTETFAAAIAPEGVLYFAGDGTSARPGWMRGAIASAHRVLSELARAVPA